MRLMKKVITLSALCIGVSSCFPNLYAAEKSIDYDRVLDYGFSSTKLYATTSGSPNFVPELKVYQETRNSKVYLVMSVNDTGMTAMVNDSSEGIVRDDYYHFSYQVTKTGWYDVEVWGSNKRKVQKRIHIDLGDSATTLNWSREYKDNACYLELDVEDKDGVKNISVNDVSISFKENSDGATASYRVYNTGTYKVVVTDKYDNKKTENIYINVNGSEPTLKLDKEYKSGKWYIIIKADSDDTVKKVTVNNKQITFPSAGGTEKYEVTKSGSYKVVMTDSSGVTKSSSIHVDINASDQKTPTVKISQNYKVNNAPGWYLLISASDDDGIASVTVNGTSVPFDSNKGEAQYYVPTDGNYTVVVTDHKGEQTTKTTYAAGNANLTNQVVQDNESATIVFKLNSKAWTKNGVSQKAMDAAPKAIHSRIYLPIRYIAYALGIDSGYITWDAATKTVTINDDSNIVKVKVGSKTMYVNGQPVVMDAAPIETGGRVMIPLSQISSAFKYRNIQLNWNNTTKQLTIKR